VELSAIFAVVANWNGGAENLECLRSLAAQGLSEAQIVFVDNGSQDGSLALVRERHPGLRLIENRTNLGFGEAANQGAVRALDLGARAVFFVNNDAVLPPGTLARLAAELDARPKAGIVGPRVLYKADPARIWCAGGLLTWRENLSTLRGHLEPDAPQWRETREVDYVPGCALLARKELLAQVGMFDPQYFAYMEDVDLCLRAQRAGFEVWLVGDAAVLHATSQATGGGYNPRRKYMMGVNSIWFLRRHASASGWLRFLVFDVASLPFLWFAGVFRGRGKAVAAKALGILDGLRGKRVTAEAIREGAGWLW
jgi:GT2 family glycosyltransferase